MTSARFPWVTTVACLALVVLGTAMAGTSENAAPAAGLIALVGAGVGAATTTIRSPALGAVATAAAVLGVGTVIGLITRNPDLSAGWFFGSLGGFGVAVAVQSSRSRRT